MASTFKQVPWKLDSPSFLISLVLKSELHFACPAYGQAAQKQGDCFPPTASMTSWMSCSHRGAEAEAILNSPAAQEGDFLETLVLISSSETPGLSVPVPDGHYGKDNEEMCRVGLCLPFASEPSCCVPMLL